MLLLFLWSCEITSDATIKSSLCNTIDLPHKVLSSPPFSLKRQWILPVSVVPMRLQGTVSFIETSSLSNSLTLRQSTEPKCYPSGQPVLRPIENTVAMWTRDRFDIRFNVFSWFLGCLRQSWSGAIVSWMCCVAGVHMGTHITGLLTEDDNDIYVHLHHDDDDCDDPWGLHIINTDWEIWCKLILHLWWRREQTINTWRGGIQSSLKMMTKHIYLSVGGMMTNSYKILDNFFIPQPSDWWCQEFKLVKLHRLSSTLHI